MVAIYGGHGCRPAAVEVWIPAFSEYDAALDRSAEAPC